MMKASQNKQIRDDQFTDLSKKLRHFVKKSKTVSHWERLTNIVKWEISVLFLSLLI